MRVGLTAMLLLGVAVTTPLRSVTDVAFADANGLHVVSVNRIDSRQHNAGFTEAPGRAGRPGILLPENYEATSAAARALPVPRHERTGV